MKLHKNMTNVELANVLTAVAAAYKIHNKPGSQFKIIAYERAADAIEHLSSEAKDVWDDGKLEDVAGIGKSIAGHLNELFTTGTSKHFTELMTGIPPATFDLLRVSGIGPKTGFRIASEFEKDFEGKDALVVLKELAVNDRIAQMEGFTEKTQTSILKSLNEVKSQKDMRLLLNYAEELATEIIDWLLEDPNILRADPLGSLRRRASTVGDLDITVSANDTALALTRFCEYPNATRVIERGDRSASIVIGGGRRVDVIASKPAAYGALLQHFTGSKHHNVALREYALKNNLSLSDYGIYTISNGKKKLVEIETEEDFYQKLGMAWIPPELREDSGEIELALTNSLPKLVELADIKGDLHVHSDFDIETSHDLGLSSMKAHIEKANELGYHYLAFTEHNPSKSKHTDKEISDLITRKRVMIDALNDTLQTSSETCKRVYNSLEIDMLTSGGLPVPDSALELLDFALVSIHTSFKLSRSEMTKRVIKSMEHPKAKIFAHPTGRKLNEREGVELDWEELFAYFEKNDKWLEINASPSRLDLPDTLVHQAVKRGIKLTISTDSHHVDHMHLMKYGVSVARRGWAESSAIANTKHLIEFEKMV